MLVCLFAIVRTHLTHSNDLTSNGELPPATNFVLEPAVIYKQIDNHCESIDFKGLISCKD